VPSNGEDVEHERAGVLLRPIFEALLAVEHLLRESGEALVTDRPRGNDEGGPHYRQLPSGGPIDSARTATGVEKGEGTSNHGAWPRCLQDRTNL
jgi:hypothetical protein